MSKIETLKGLPTPSELRRSVQELASLEHLPRLVSDEVTQALAPLMTLRQDVTRVLEAYDQVTAAQRRALDSLTAEMSASAAAAIEQRVAHLDKTLREMSAQVQSLRAATGAAEASAKGMQALPRQIAASAAQAAE